MIPEERVAAVVTVEKHIPLEAGLLEGASVRLEPLSRDHLRGLVLAGAGTEVFRWFVASEATERGLAAFIEAALAEQERGLALPFATVEKATGLVAGSTRFAAIDRAHRRAEIGWTWLGPRWQRTALNTEAKLLMLDRAFTHWGCVRVEFKTDLNNRQSQQALERLGATREGVFRKHYLCADGRVRDSVWYSILDDEWPVLRERLLARLHQG